MAGGTVTAGLRSWIGSTASTSAPDEVVFSDKYQYAQVTNLSGTAGQILYVTTDGTTPETSGASNTLVVAPGQSVLVANQLGYPEYYHSDTVIPQGSNANALGAITSSNPSTPSAPGFTTQQRALEGQASNPGMKVYVLGSAASMPYAVEAAG